MRTFLRSLPTNIFLAKVWGPLLCVAAAIFLWSGNGGFFSRNFFLACPFVIAALFGVSVAILEVRGGILRYRRFFIWKPLPPEGIIGARIEAPPVLGSIRLRRFLFPWGRLYFALDANLGANPFREGKYALLDFIRDRKELILERHGSAEQSS